MSTRIACPLSQLLGILLVLSLTGWSCKSAPAKSELELALLRSTPSAAEIWADALSGRDWWCAIADSPPGPQDATSLEQYKRHCALQRTLVSVSEPVFREVANGTRVEAYFFDVIAPTENEDGDAGFAPSRFGLFADGSTCERVRQQATTLSAEHAVTTCRKWTP